MSLPLKEWSEDPEALENNPLIGLFEPLHLALRTVVSCCLTADASTSILASLSVVIFSEVKPEKTKRVEDNDDHWSPVNSHCGTNSQTKDDCRNQDTRRLQAEPNFLAGIGACRSAQDHSEAQLVQIVRHAVGTGPEIIQSKRSNSVNSIKRLGAASFVLELPIQNLRWAERSTVGTATNRHR